STALPPRPWSLAVRLMVWYAVSSFTLVALIVAYLYWTLTANLDRQNDQFLADQALPLVNLLREGPVDNDAVQRQIELSKSGWPAPSVYLRLLNERGKGIASTPAMGLIIPKVVFPEPQPYDRGAVRGTTLVTGDDHSFRLLAVQTASPSGQPSFIIQVAMDRTHEEELLAGYRRNL